MSKTWEDTLRFPTKHCNDGGVVPDELSSSRTCTPWTPVISMAADVVTSLWLLPDVETGRLLPNKDETTLLFSVGGVCCSSGDTPNRGTTRGLNELLRLANDDNENVSIDSGGVRGFSGSSALSSTLFWTAAAFGSATDSADKTRTRRLLEDGCCLVSSDETAAVTRRSESVFSRSWKDHRRLSKSKIIIGRIVRARDEKLLRYLNTRSFRRRESSTVTYPGTWRPTTLAKKKALI